MRSALTVSVLATALPLAAQGDHFTTSPPGWENVEGATSIDLIGKEPLLRFQQINSVQLAPLNTRNRVAFRRDGMLGDNIDYGPRTVELELIMAETAGAPSTTFAANLDANAVTVIARKQVSLPDWTFKPATAPAPESSNAVLVFDSPTTWSYAGKQASGNDYVFDIKVYSNTAAGKGYPMDADAFITTSLTGPTSSIGSGCIATGQTAEMRNSMAIASDGTQFHVTLGVIRGVANSLGAFVISPTEVNVNLGWCGNIYAVPVFSTPIPLNANGEFNAAVALPVNAAWVGSSLVSQAACADPGQAVGVAVSRGTSAMFPPNPSGGPGIKHLYALDPAATVATSGIVNGGVVFWTNHP